MVRSWQSLLFLIQSMSNIKSNRKTKFINPRCEALPCNSVLFNMIAALKLPSPGRKINFWFFASSTLQDFFISFSGNKRISTCVLTFRLSANFRVRTLPTHTHSSDISLNRLRYYNIVKKRIRHFFHIYFPDEGARIFCSSPFSAEMGYLFFYATFKTA